MTPLSVLDLSPVTTGNSGPQALRNSIDLAPSRRPARLHPLLGGRAPQHAEHRKLGARHHDRPDRRRDDALRVGSGGVMLPNHAPLQVAERFKVLEGLFPGRIDLGLGRAPGTDPATSYALRRRQDDPAGDDFLDRFQELLAFEGRLFPNDHPFRKVNAMPADVPLPPLYLLGSSGYSAQLAAHVGAGFSFAHHFSDFDPVGPMMIYREQFKPSATRDKPLAILARARGLRRHRRRRRAARHLGRSELRAAAAGPLSADPEPRGSGGAQLFADRPRADRPEPCASGRRQQGQGDGASRAADRSDRRPTS